MDDPEPTPPPRKRPRRVGCDACGCARRIHALYLGMHTCRCGAVFCAHHRTIAHPCVAPAVVVPPSAEFDKLQRI